MPVTPEGEAAAKPPRWAKCMFTAALHGMRWIGSVAARQAGLPTEADGNRTVSQNSFRDNDFGDGAKSACAKSYANEPDSDLQAVIEAWPKLPAATRRKIVRLVQSAAGGE